MFFDSYVIDLQLKPYNLLKGGCEMNQTIKIEERLFMFKYGYAITTRGQLIYKVHGTKMSFTKKLLITDKGNNILVTIQ